MADNRGWVKLQREWYDREWYGSVNCMAVMMHLLLTVQQKPKTWRGVTTDAGQLVTTIEAFAKKLGLSRYAVIRAIERLKASGDVNTSPHNKKTIITLAGWDDCDIAQTEPHTSPHTFRTHSAHIAAHIPHTSPHTSPHTNGTGEPLTTVGVGDDDDRQPHTSPHTNKQGSRTSKRTPAAHIYKSNTRTQQEEERERGAAPAPHPPVSNDGESIAVEAPRSHPTNPVPVPAPSDPSPGSARPPSHSRSGKRSVEDRKAEFREACRLVVEADQGRLPAGERGPFYAYWTEESRSGMMRFEAEKFFDHGRRMDTWRRTADSRGFRGAATPAPAPQQPYGWLNRAPASEDQPATTIGQ